MEQDQRTPFEREIAAVSAIHPLDVVYPPVEIVLTDGIEVFERRTVKRSEVAKTLEQLNARSEEATAGNLAWRQAVLNHRDAGDRGHIEPATSYLPRGRDGVPIW